MSTPESQHPNPGCEWYHPTTISGLQYQAKKEKNEKNNIRQSNQISEPKKGVTYLRMLTMEALIYSIEI
jgi:hypothetical protein